MRHRSPYATRRTTGTSRPTHPATLLSSSLAALLSLVVVLAPSRARAGGPKEVVRSSHEKINELLRKEKRSKSPKASLDAKMKKIINQFLDFDSLATASMSRHWDKLTAGQKKEFVSLFRQLIESSYIKRLRGDLDYKVVYGKVERSGSSAKVPTTVERIKRGRKSETKIVYELHRKGGRWRVVDVVTNEVSLARNYRRSFGKIMRRDGYPALIRKMKSKINSYR